jgi:hypothetical protein
MRRKLLPLILASALVVAVAPAAMAQNNSRQLGLVNVSAGDVDLLNGVNLAVAANVLVTACDFTVAAAIAAVQGVADLGPTTCTSATGPITIEQSQPGDGGGTPNVGGNNSRQAGLVNVSLGDVAILNDVNIAAAANVLITACDFTVAAAILAVQGVADGGQTTCDADAREIVIQQAQ